MGKPRHRERKALDLCSHAVTCPGSPKSALVKAGFEPKSCGPSPPWRACIQLPASLESSSAWHTVGASHALVLGVSLSYVAPTVCAGAVCAVVLQVGTLRPGQGAGPWPWARGGQGLARRVAAQPGGRARASVSPSAEWAQPPQRRARGRHSPTGWLRG